MKALILYPTKSVASDQEVLLGRCITQRDAPATAGSRRPVHAVSADGKTSGPRTKITEHSLITDRAIIRDDPPDILLTNYKMLDQLLLRSADQRL